VFAQSSGINSAGGGPAGGRTAASAEITLRAFQNSYPDKVENVSFIDNDWTITAKGVTYYWAGGRLLPKELLENMESYSPHMFYTIPAKPAPPESFTPEYI